jgi:TRAP-type mannitol/chloroaromatic compound transport system substrate-binding protein
MISKVMMGKEVSTGGVASKPKGQNSKSNLCNLFEPKRRCEMGMVKRGIDIALTCILAASLFSATAIAQEKKAAEESKIVIRLQSAFAAVLPALGECLPFFKEHVEAASGGTIEVKYYDPGKLVPPFEIHDAVSSGKIEAGYTAPVYLAGKLPATELFTYIPFGCDIPAYMGWFYSGNGMKLYQEAYDNAGYNLKAFLFCVLAPETAGWFRKPINKPEDLKGLAIRYPGLPGKVLQKLGASISLIPGSEIYQALEKGAIDGTEFSTPAIDAKLGFYKVAKYNYFPGWHQPATNLELVINKDTWNKMSPRQKAVIELAVRAVTTYTVARSTAIQGAAIVENAKKGVNNMVFSQEMLDLFHKTWLEVIEEETAKDPMLKKIWEDYKAYEAEYIPWACMAYLPRPKCK